MLDGKWLKIIIGIAFISLFVLVSGTLLEYFCASLKLIYFPNTPTYIITAIFLLAAIIANRAGTKAITNINLIIVPIRVNKYVNHLPFNCKEFCI